MILVFFILIKSRIKRKIKNSLEMFREPTECGFLNIEKVRSSISIYIYINIVLFLILDLEILILIFFLLNIKVFLEIEFLLFLFIVIFSIFIEWKIIIFSWY